MIVAEQLIVVVWGPDLLPLARPEADAVDAIWIQELRVVSVELSGAGRRRRIARVDSDEGAKDCRRVGDGTGMGSDRVLSMRDRHDPGPADQADGGFDSDHAVLVGGAHDAAIRLCPD